jgi:hypothetical protein
MQIRRLALIGLTLAAPGTVFADIAHGALSPQSSQEVELDRACGAVADSVDTVIGHASSAQPETIQSQLVVVTPGTLTGRIAFNRYGKHVMVSADAASSTQSGFGCSQGRAGRHGLGPGRSRVVSTLTRTFAKAGTYTVTFRLNQVGRTLLGQLAAAQKAYGKQHPHGHERPSLAFGVALSYESGG